MSKFHADAASAAADAAQRPTMLTRRSAEILQRIENMIEKASKALIASDPPPPGPRRGAGVMTPDAVAAATDTAPPQLARGAN